MMRDTPRSFATFFRKAVRGAREEIALFYTRPLLAQAASNALPQLTFKRTRTALLRAGGLRIGQRSLVMGPLILTGVGDRQELFSVGSECVITGPLRVDLGAEVRIGDRVYIGHDVALLTVDHEIGPSFQRCGREDRLPIFLGDGCWIGSRVRCAPGPSSSAPSRPGGATSSSCGTAVTPSPDGRRWWWTSCSSSSQRQRRSTPMTTPRWSAGRSASTGQSPSMVSHPGNSV